MNDIQLNYETNRFQRALLFYNLIFQYVLTLQTMSAFFSFDSMIIVVLFFICTASYIRAAWPSFIEPHKTGFRGIIRSAAVIGDRLSPFVSVLCIGMAVFNLAR